MSRSGELFDSNIIIDALNGYPLASQLLSESIRPAISVVTWMEVIAGVPVENESEVRLLLERLLVVPLDRAVIARNVGLRRGSRRKLLDSIILASAQESERWLVTRNTRDFPAGMDGVLLPYEL